MREVIRIDKIEENEKPVEITHYLSSSNGWETFTDKLDTFDRVVYLGKDDIEGDVFAIYDDEYIHFAKGHLNSGKY